MKTYSSTYLLLPVIFLLSVSLCFAAPSEAPQKAKEFHIKALFLYNFANFVEWPEDAFSDKSTKLKMCLYGLSL
ncbi:MAG: YfiR family protein, partial [Pseudomonadales bacterium]|nr:YfiR family protein [Pseudomonadales bacterium]